jgi:Amt family ammonium transporter
LLLFAVLTLLLWPEAARAQGAAASSAGEPLTMPTFWYLLAAAIAMLVPAGLTLVAVAGLDAQQAWTAALNAVAAIGLAGFAYWAVGFALQFGGVGLVYPQAELRALVWEWSPLSTEWGMGWGMAGLSGWFLSGTGVTGLAYALFLSQLPWVMTAAILPVLALRGRAPMTATLLLAALMGGVVFPLAGNWVQGGGWLNALGRNMGLGHGFVDFGGAGTVHLVAAGFALAALGVWSPRRRTAIQPELTLAQQPLLAVTGALLALGGVAGWLWANPLQVETLSNVALMRGTVNILLATSSGAIVPVLYTWFVTGRSEPGMAARGLIAGMVAGLAGAPFLQPGMACFVGLVAGATVPFVSYLLDGRLRLEDNTGIIVAGGVPAVIGLLLVGLFADGAAGSGWQMTGLDSYLGVTGQGVSGLLVGGAYQPDFPGQLQAQVLGVTTLALWGFLSGLIVCAPLGLLYHGLLNREAAPATGAPAANPGAPLLPPAPGYPVQAEMPPAPRSNPLPFGRRELESPPGSRRIDDAPLQQ